MLEITINSLATYRTKNESVLSRIAAGHQVVTCFYFKERSIVIN